MNYNKKHAQPLETIFSTPINGNIQGSRIEALLKHICCTVIEGSGSSVTFEKDGKRAYFHRPHPYKEALRYRVVDVKIFLESLGIEP